LSAAQRGDNKLVYFIIEDAVQGSPLASSYIKPVAIHNGFEAYYTLVRARLERQNRFGRKEVS
jgi:hypothetical protein